MSYYLGLDAGGTKTVCYIGDETGTVLGTGKGGPANYQTAGIETTETSVRTAIAQAVAAAGIEIADISFGTFGMSGADEPMDFDVLEPMCRAIMGHVPHEVFNDTWIGLRTGAQYGIVSICGTGAAHAGRNPEGKRMILRNLDYTLGNLGGGSDVVGKAMHYAFRSDEETYDRSELETVIPEVFGLSDMDEVCVAVRENDWEVPGDAAFRIPIETMRLATEGDDVAKMIIGDMGREEGRYAAGLIRRLGMTGLDVPLVLIGSMFATGNPVLVDPYLEEARKAAPGAHIIIPTDPPVLGALLLAIESADN